MKKRILIVDNERMNRAILGAILGGEYDILEAEGGKQALELLSANPTGVSAVLLDIMMPGMDGYETLKRIRSNGKLNAVPVIVETALSEEDAMVKALSLGANGFASKPYNPDLIRHSIKNSIELSESTRMVQTLKRDGLTKLFNREAFFEEALARIQKRAPGSYDLICFDVDQFKILNDHYGSEKGDEVLLHIADCIARGVPPIGGLCGRMTADHFALLIPADADWHAVMEIRRRASMPACIDQTLQIRSGQYHINDLSLPVSAMYDRAMLAEDTIRGRYDQLNAVYEDSMRDRMLREQRIVSKMHEALEQNRFEVWVQPQFNHVTGALIGAEALVRWRDDDGTLIPPDKFVPIFEKNGFIYQMDRCVWEQSCAILRRFMDEGKPTIPISVNVSRTDVFRADFIEVITGLTKKYRIPPELLRLEITESAFSEEADRIVRVIKRLIELGFTVEIDDFGSGYSSLNTLKDVPSTVLKLDMKFLSRTDETKRGGNILESVVRMAKWMGMSVVAEGVEKREQADFLKSIGCKYVQGFLYAKPMPVAEYEKILTSRPSERMTASLNTVENIDNSALWNPESMDSFIFNSFVGGACIFEYYDSDAELLRSNEKFARLLGGDAMTSEGALTLDILSYFDAESRAKLKESILRAIKTKAEITEEYRLTDLPDGKKEAFFLVTLRAIASSEGRVLFYCTAESTTAQRVAERKLAESAAQQQIILEHIGSGLTVLIQGEQEGELLFANNRFYELMGCTREQYHHESGKEYSLIEPEDRPAVRAALEEANHSDAPVTLTYRINQPTGKLIWIRTIISMCRLPGVPQPVQLAVFSDITEEKSAEQKIMDADDQLRFLNAAAHDLLAQPDVPAAINGVLKRTLRYFAAKRAYIFELDDANKTMSNTYEVCADGVTKEIDNLQNVPMREAEIWFEIFKKQDYINIPDVLALDDSRRDKAVLLAQNIRSLFTVALRRDGKLIGYIGVDDPGLWQTNVTHLAAIGDYITVMLTRRDLNERIRQDHAAMQMLMDDTPGGFCRMQIKRGAAPAIVYANEGFAKMLGLSMQDLMSVYGDNAGRLISKNDHDLVREDFQTALRDGGQFTARCRLLRRNAPPLPAMVFARFVEDETGARYLNAYFTDLTEQLEKEEQQKTILDNLPCGAALYDYDADKRELWPIHSNRRFWELIGRTPEEHREKVAIESVHPNDRAVVIKELRDAVHSGRDAACDFKIRTGSGAYKPFHVAARLIPQTENRYLLFVSYTPISDEVMSYQEMLPIALSTVINATSNIGYVKDRDFRYISCSPSFAKLAGFASEKDMIGKTDFDFLGEESAKRYRAEDEEIYRTKQPRLNAEEILPFSKQSLRYGSTSKFPLLDAAGNVIGIYGMTRDVTEERSAYERLRFLTDSIPGGLATYECRADGIKRTYFNEGFYAYAGYTREEFEKRTEKDGFALIFEADKAKVREQIQNMIRNGRRERSGECVYRCLTKTGEIRWFSLKGSAVDDAGDFLIINVVKYDITAQMETLSKLRISEEENRLAIAHSGNIITKFDVQSRTLALPEAMPAIFRLPKLLKNMPGEQIALGRVSPETADAYTELFEGVVRGEKSGTATYQQNSTKGWRWLEAQYTTVFSDSGKPVSAVISFADVTERLEKEVVYNKWQQSLSERPQDSYTLFRYNLTKDASHSSREGGLLKVEFDNALQTFNERTEAYAAQCVAEEDRERYLSFLNADKMLASYHRGHRSDVLEYRKHTKDGGRRWIRLTVDLVEYPFSTDIEAYLMYEDVDEHKRMELLTLERSERDPLTNTLNRATFIARVDEILRASRPGEQHALLMLDIDAFKQVNDSLGHGAGDQVLLDLTREIGVTLRRDDLLGRLGGDEFFVFLKDVKGAGAAAAKAQRIGALEIRAQGSKARITVSIGIAMAPRDGRDFDTLYKKADAALYREKEKGKGSFLFYEEPEKNE